MNKFFNALAYNPPGAAEGYLFWALWLNHIGASVYSTQDALGPIRRGVILTDCIALGALENVAEDRRPARNADRSHELPDLAADLRTSDGGDSASSCRNRLRQSAASW